jgi:hypothetical protein
VVATLVVMWVCACGGSEIAPGDKAACVPGQSISCTGVGPCSGSQTCKTDGTGYDVCLCSATDSGGSPRGVADASAHDSSPHEGASDDGAATGRDSAMDSLTDAPGSDGSSSSKGIDAGDANADSGPTNLISAGDFPDGTTLWAMAEGPNTLAIEGGRGCVTLLSTSGSTSTLDWNRPVHWA